MGTIFDQADNSATDTAEYSFIILEESILPEVAPLPVTLLNLIYYTALSRS